MEGRLCGDFILQKISNTISGPIDPQIERAKIDAIKAVILERSYAGPIPYFFEEMFGFLFDANSQLLYSTCLLILVALLYFFAYKRPTCLLHEELVLIFYSICLCKMNLHYGYTIEISKKISEIILGAEGQPGYAGIAQLYGPILFCIELVMVVGFSFLLLRKRIYRGSARGLLSSAIFLMHILVGLIVGCSHLSVSRSTDLENGIGSLLGLSRRFLLNGNSMALLWLYVAGCSFYLLNVILDEMWRIAKLKRYERFRSNEHKNRIRDLHNAEKLRAQLRAEIQVYQQLLQLPRNKDQI